LHKLAFFLTKFKNQVQKPNHTHFFSFQVQKPSSKTNFFPPKFKNQVQKPNFFLVIFDGSASIRYISLYVYIFPYLYPHAACNKSLSEAWLLGCLVAWLLGCLVAWLLGCLVAWLLGSLMIRKRVPSHLSLRQKKKKKIEDAS
jgi:hypothetical protein